MSFPYTPNLQDAKIESLRTQLEYLNLLRVRYLQWMNSTSDPGTKHMHFKIAELVERLTDDYVRLLDSQR